MYMAGRREIWEPRRPSLGNNLQDSILAVDDEIHRILTSMLVLSLEVLRKGKIVLRHTLRNLRPLGRGFPER